MYIDSDELNLTRSDSASENELSSPETPSWGPPVGNIPGTVLPPFIVLPSRPTFPSRPNSSTASIRFLHAAQNQSAINIRLGNRNVINDMRFGNFTPYYTNTGNHHKIKRCVVPLQKHNQ